MRIIGIFALFRLVQALVCNNMIPGLDKQQRGIDASTYDMFGQNPGYSPAPLIEFTCNQGRTVIISGQTYSLPDQVLGQPEQLPYTQTEYVDVLNFNSYNYQQTMSSTIGTTYMFGMFSNSETYQTSINYINAQNRMAGIITSQVSANEIYLIPIDPYINSSLSLDPQVCNPLALSLASTYPIFNTTSLDAYEEFISYCGTHYLSTASYGGWIISMYYTQTSFLQTMTSVQIEQQAEANFMNFLKESGGADGSQTTIDTQYTSATITDTFTRGGSGSPSGPNTFTSWENSVAQNPWIWNAVTLPNYLLVPTSIQTSMCLAIQNHLSVAFLKSEVLSMCDIWIQQLTPWSELSPCGYSGDCDLDSSGIQICENEWNMYNPNSVSQPWLCCSVNYGCIEPYPPGPPLCCCSTEVNATSYNTVPPNAKTLLLQVEDLQNEATMELQSPIVNQTNVNNIGYIYTNISMIMQSPMIPVYCTRTGGLYPQCACPTGQIIIADVNVPQMLLSL